MLRNINQRAVKVAFSGVFNKFVMLQPAKADEDAILLFAMSFSFGPKFKKQPSNTYHNCNMIQDPDS